MAKRLTQSQWTAERQLKYLLTGEMPKELSGYKRPEDSGLGSGKLRQFTMASVGAGERVHPSQQAGAEQGLKKLRNAGYDENMVFWSPGFGPGVNNIYPIGTVEQLRGAGYNASKIQKVLPSGVPNLKIGQPRNKQAGISKLGKAKPSGAEITPWEAGPEIGPTGTPREYMYRKGLLPRGFHDVVGRIQRASVTDMPAGGRGKKFTLGGKTYYWGGGKLYEEDRFVGGLPEIQNPVNLTRNLLNVLGYEGSVFGMTPKQEEAFAMERGWAGTPHYHGAEARQPTPTPTAGDASGKSYINAAGRVVTPRTAQEEADMKKLGFRVAGATGKQEVMSRAQRILASLQREGAEGAEPTASLRARAIDYLRGQGYASPDEREIQSAMNMLSGGPTVSVPPPETEAPDEDWQDWSQRTSDALSEESETPGLSDEEGALIEAQTEYFEDLRGRLESPDEDEREEARKEAEEYYGYALPTAGAEYKYPEMKAEIEAEARTLEERAAEDLTYQQDQIEAKKKSLLEDYNYYLEQIESGELRVGEDKERDLARRLEQKKEYIDQWEFDVQKNMEQLQRGWIQKGGLFAGPRYEAAGRYRTGAEMEKARYLSGWRYRKAGAQTAHERQLEDYARERARRGQLYKRGLAGAERQLERYEQLKERSVEDIARARLEDIRSLQEKFQEAVAKRMATTLGEKYYGYT